MKQRHTQGARAYARAVLAAANVAVGQDYHTLTSSQVDRVLEEADRIKYRKPPNANGSRARYFHDLLQRRASIEKA